MAWLSWSDAQMEKDHNAFLARMSHELRTPLNAIIGYSEMITEDLEDGEPIDRDELQASMDRILGASRRLLGQVQSILDLTQLEAGKYEVRPEQVDMPALVGRVEAIAKPIAIENSDVLHFAIDPDLTFVADIRMVEAILSNLVQNACKFTRNGEVRVEIRRSGPFALFRVQDNGIGMTPRQIEQASRPFEQADTTSTRQYDGSGVGLAVCKGFAELMGGAMVVESTPGRGATVLVRIPLEVQVLGPDEWLDDEDETLYGR